MITVTTQQGHSVDFPDGTPADVIDKTMKEHFAPETPVSLGGFAGAAGAGLVKGAAGAEGIIGDIREFSKGLADKLGIDPQTVHDFAKATLPNIVQTVGHFAPTSQELTQQAEKLTGPLHVAGNVPERYVETAASFVPGSFLGPGGYGGSLGRSAVKAASNALTYGVVPGLASEAAGQALKGTPYEEPARIGAALAGGGVGGYLRSKTAIGKLREGLPNFVTEAHINKAEALINEAQARGIAITWPEAISEVVNQPVHTSTQRMLEHHYLTRASMADALKDRPQQFDVAVGREMGNLAPATDAPQLIGPQAQRAAEQTIAEGKKAINVGLRPFYQQAEAVKVAPEEMTRLTAMPGFAEATQYVRNGPFKTYVEHLPDDSVGFLDEVKKRLYAQGTRLKSRFNNQQDVQLGNAWQATSGEVADVAKRASPFYESALEGQAALRQKYIEPLMQGPLGKVMKSATTEAAINALFPQRVLPRSHIAVDQAVTNLVRRNPLAAGQLVRAHIERTFDETIGGLVQGENAWGAAKWRKAVGGQPQRLENLRAAVQALPDGQARWNSLEKLLDISGASGRRLPVGSPTAFTEKEFEGLKTGGRTLGAVKFALSPKRWMSLFDDSISSWQLGNNMEQLARIITDPRAGNIFRALAKTDGNATAKIRALGGRLLAQTWRPIPGLEARAQEKAQSEMRARQ